MGTDVKIGLALGLVVVVVGIVIFSLSGGKGSQPGETAVTTPGEQAPSGGIGTGRSDGGPTGSTDRQQEITAVIDPRVFLARPEEAETRQVSPGPGVEAGRTDGADTRTLLIQGPPPAARSVQHVVKAGDTLWGLSRQYYRTSTGVSKIQQANRDKLPTEGSPLSIGMTLVIPDVPAVREAVETTGPSELGPSPTTVGPTGAGDANYDTYTVRPGDNLSLIARRYYGNDRLIDPIIRANPRVAANPNRLVAGWTLRIPRLAGVAAGERTARRDID